MGKNWCFNNLNTSTYTASTLNSRIINSQVKNNNGYIKFGNGIIIAFVKSDLTLNKPFTKNLPITFNNVVGMGYVINGTHDYNYILAGTATYQYRIDGTDNGNYRIQLVFIGY